MKTTVWVLAVASFGVLLLAKPSQAVYVDRITHEPITAYYSRCVLTPDPTQKSATTVYTLNISKTTEVDAAYKIWWNRVPRCDELQYHAEHGTSIDKLNSWLKQVEIQRYKDHYYDGIIKTHDQGTYNNAKIWRLINGKRQRIYDWPTQAAWGYLFQDIRQMPLELNNEILNAYPEITSLQYSDGPYKAQVEAMWRNGATTVNVPARLQAELTQFGVTYGMFYHRNACSNFTRGCPSGYDWTFLYDNPQI